MKNKYSDMINRLLTLNFFAMRKLYVYVAMFAIGTMAACQKNTDVVPQDDNNVVIDDNSKVAVELGVSGINLDVNVTSKGAGAIDSWKQNALYVYAFDRTITNFETGDAFIDNVQGTAPGEVSPVEDADTVTVGKITLLNPNVGEGDEPFYYSGSTTYDFYGYYIDDAALESAIVENVLTPEKEATRIYIPFRIDGTQDLMIAKADQATDVARPAVTETVNEANAYSAYAARRGVQPVLKFQHLLSRFMFEIAPGAASADGVTIDSIALESKVEGNLVVVGATRGIETVEAEPDTLNLPGIATSGVKTAKWQTGVAKEEQTKTPVGTDLLVMPGETSYKLFVWMHKDTGATKVEPLISEVKFEAGTAFEAGKQYNVTITVYGLEEVEVTAHLTGWEDGGDITIDPDEMPTTDDEQQGGGEQGTEEPQP